MRINAGRFRGRRLLPPPGRVTRPITARVKERLFGRLGPLVESASVLDVFAGTGTIGLEALSRGARSAVFIERDPAAAELLRRNAATLGVGDMTLVWSADVFRCSFKPRDAEELFPFGLVFFDPPYPDVGQCARGRPLWKALRRIARDDVTTADATLVLRVPTGGEPDRPDEWVERGRFTDGGMTLHEWGKTEKTAVEAVTTG